MPKVGLSLGTISISFQVPWIFWISMRNAPIHKNADIRKYIEQRGYGCAYLLSPLSSNQLDSFGQCVKSIAVTTVAFELWTINLRIMVTAFKAAWVIVLTSSNNYIKGVIAMKYALHTIHNSRYPLLILYTSSVKSEIVDILKSIGCLVKKIDSIKPAGKVEYKSKRFEETWTKLAVWNEVEYDRLVMLDADMLPLQNMDELIEMDLPRDWVAASYACTCNPQKIKHYPLHWIPENCAYTGLQSIQPPLIGEKSDYFNSGLVVLSPEKEMFDTMLQRLNSLQDLNIYPFPDQDFLNEVFKYRWKPISYTYNALKTLHRSHESMWDIKSVKNLHFILTKPWDIAIDQELSDLEHTYKPLYEFWWKTYSELNAFVDTKKLDKLLT